MSGSNANPSATPASTAERRRKRGIRAISHEVTFGKAYDGRLVRRLAVFFRPHLLLFGLSMLSYPVVALFGLVQPYLIKVAIDQYLVAQPIDVGLSSALAASMSWNVGAAAVGQVAIEQQLAERHMVGFEWIVVLTVAAIVAEFFAKFVQTILTQLLGQRVCRDLRVTLFRRLQAVDLSYIERNPVGRLMTRVTNDVESLQETFSMGAISIIGDIVTLVGIVTMMLLLDWKLTLYAFAVLPLLVVFVSAMRSRARDAFRRVRTLLSQMNAFLNEAISGMTLIQAFRQERYMQAEFRDVNASYRDANFLSIRYDAMTYAVVEGLSTVATASILILGISLFNSGAVEVGLFVAFVEYLRRFFMPINELSTKYTVLQSAMASAERCVDLLDQTPSVQNPDAPVSPPPLTDAVRFEKVTFGYGEQPKVFSGLDFALRQGEKVAVVGPTGAGKSTIVKLLARFYDPDEGVITYDGVDIRKMTIDDLRGRIAVVLQDPYLFDGTIEENIRFGHPHLSQEALEKAAERTQATAVVNRHPDGWSTRVGERGGQLSAGERQLIAFARALAADPQVLILDEATSSVDPETEALIQQGLEALLEERTALIIAHRLSTIRRADRIVVLSEGQVVEEGSHAELLEQDGLYRKLHELQFADAEAEAA